MHELIQFILEQAASQPVPKRIRIYRELHELTAAIPGAQCVRVPLLRLTEHLESAQEQSDQIIFDFAHCPAPTDDMVELERRRIRASSSPRETQTPHS